MADRKKSEDEVRQALEKNPILAKKVERILRHFTQVGESFWLEWVRNFVDDFATDPWRYGPERFSKMFNKKTYTEAEAKGARFIDLFNMREYREAEAQFKIMLKGEFFNFDKAKQAYFTAGGGQEEFNLMWRAVTLAAQDRYDSPRRRYYTPSEKGGVIVDDEDDELRNELMSAIFTALPAKIVGNNIRGETAISELFRRATGDLAIIVVNYRTPCKVARLFRSSWEMGKW
nr:hypothetical protein [Candidatus Njordarchaeota archaeon]